MNPVIWIVLGAIGLYSFSRTANVLLKLTLDPQNARIHKVALTNSDVRFDLLVKNYSDKAAVLQKYDVQIIYAGKVIATLFKENLKISIARKATTLIKDISANVSSLSVLTNIIDAFGGSMSSSIIIKGSITADGIKFPFEKSIQLITTT